MTTLQAKSGNGHAVPDSVLLGQEADHRIANNLGLITSLLRLRARRVSEGAGSMDRDEVRRLLEDIAARVDTVAQLHRLLSHSYRGATVDLRAYLRDLCHSLAEALSTTAEAHVHGHYDEGCALPPDQVLPLGLVAAELITNAVKYAHPSGSPVRIDIDCRQIGDKLLLEIADDGVGLPEHFNPITDGGLGLRMVRSLAAQLGAILTFDSRRIGTRVRLEMPLPPDASA